MSDRSGFTGGFIAGAFLGGIVGGVVGAVVASRNRRIAEEADNGRFFDGDSRGVFAPEDSVEMARRSLEDKIAQLNNAIDEARQQLNNVQERGLES